MASCKSVIIFLATFLFVSVVVADSDICCMPRGHRVSLRTSVATFSNCTASGCATNNLIMSYTHYPDLDNYRYRMDCHSEPSGAGLFFEGTTLGFITNKTSLLGFELIYDDKQCICRRTIEPSIIYNITCVTDALKFVGNVSIGIGFEAQLYRSNSTSTASLNTIEATYDMIVQNFSKDKGNVPLCALIHEDWVTRETVTSTGQLVALSMITLEAFNLTPYANDNDYVIPAHCPKSC